MARHENSFWQGVTHGVGALVSAPPDTSTHAPTPRSGFGRRMIRGALAGAAAAGALFAFRLLFRTERRDAEGTVADGGVGDVVDELLAGAGRGLIYAALLAPHLPGPPVLRGAIVGTADYLAVPLGGVFSRLQALSPIRRVPVVSILLETGDAEDEPYLTFLAHGMLLGILYGRDAEAS